MMAYVSMISLKSVEYHFHQKKNITIQIAVSKQNKPRRLADLNYKPEKNNQNDENSPLLFFLLEYF
jgi:hypothetical protein